MVFQKTSSMPFFFKSSTIFEPKKLKEPQASHKNLTLTPAAARSVQTSIRRWLKSSVTNINVSKTIDFSALAQSVIIASQAFSFESYIFQLVSGLGIDDMNYLFISSSACVAIAEKALISAELNSLGFVSFMQKTATGKPVL